MICSRHADVWTTHAGRDVCAVCHPPANESLVASRSTREPAGPPELPGPGDPDGPGQVTPIEWPRGSGRVAGYLPFERDVMRALADSPARGHCTEEEMIAQVTLVHDAKFLFDARIVE